MVFTTNKEFELDLAKGRVSGHARFDAMGERPSLAFFEQGEDIWQGPTSQIPIPDQTVGVQLCLSSTSRKDTLLGPGVRRVRVHYLDGFWAEQTEIIDLKGRTPALSKAIDVKFVQAVYAVAVGNNSVAAGDISVSDDGSGDTYVTIASGGNMCLTCTRMVPAGAEFFLKKWTCSSAGSRQAAIRLRATCDAQGNVYGGNNPVFLFKDTAHLENASYTRTFEPPLRLPARSIIKCSAQMQKKRGGAAISATFEGILVRSPNFQQ